MQLSQAFAEMMFKHGFVHCDPHAANVLVPLCLMPSEAFFGEALIYFSMKTVGHESPFIFRYIVNRFGWNAYTHAISILALMVIYFFVNMSNMID